MRLTEQLDNLKQTAAQLKKGSILTDPDHKAKYKKLVAQTKQCEDVLKWFRKEITKPTVQMQLDPFLTQGEICFPMTNTSGHTFRNFSFECEAQDYNSVVLGRGRVATETWPNGEMREFRISVPKASKHVTILVDSVDFVPGDAAAEEKPKTPVVDTVCPYCRREIIAFSKFCNHCGRQLMTDKERTDMKAEILMAEIHQEKTRYLEVLDAVGPLLKESDLAEKVARLRDLSEKIYTRIEQRPDQLPQVKKFDNIYLPAISNAVTTYVAVRDGGVNLDKVEKARDNVRLAIDIGTEASQKLLDSLYKGDLLDVEGDMDVLRQMFAKKDSPADPVNLREKIKEVVQARPPIPDLQEALAPAEPEEKPLPTPELVLPGETPSANAEQVRPEEKPLPTPELVLPEDPE